MDRKTNQDRHLALFEDLAGAGLNGTAPQTIVVRQAGDSITLTLTLVSNDAA